MNLSSNKTLVELALFWQHNISLIGIKVYTVVYFELLFSITSVN